MIHIIEIKGLLIELGKKAVSLNIVKATGANSPMQFANTLHIIIYSSPLKTIT
jgi:hypothetical protein